jgi:hypothetical protein
LSGFKFYNSYRAAKYISTCLIYIAAMQRALDGVESSTRLLVAIRRAADIATLAAHKLNTFTISTGIAEALFSVPETLNATADFE